MRPFTPSGKPFPLISAQVLPASADFQRPEPGPPLLREFGSPVPAHTVFVSDGAMASMPMEMMFLSSNTGRHVTPLLVLFQMPPPAAATKSVFDGPGMPTTSDRRPMNVAGPTVRHLKPATVAESRDWARADVAAKTARSPRAEEMRRPDMRLWGERGAGGSSQTITLGSARMLDCARRRIEWRTGRAC